MAETIEVAIDIACPGLMIEQVDISDSAVKKEWDMLREISISERGFIYLDESHPKFMFFARLPDVGEIVGYSFLKYYGFSDDYGVTCLTHPSFEGRGIATSLVGYVLEFAKKMENIEELFAHVNQGSSSERIIRKAGFIHHSATKRPRNRRNITYKIDTTNRERLIEFDEESDIGSDLVGLLKEFKPRRKIADYFSLVNWCNSVLCAYLCSDNERFSEQDAQRILGNFFQKSFVYPNTPGEMLFPALDISHSLRAVNPNLLGSRKVLAQRGQNVFYNKLDGKAQVAVLKPFEDEPICGLSMYELVQRH